MSNENKSYRIRTTVGADGSNYIDFKLDNTVDKFELLSLTINQTNMYRLMSSDTGLVVGRVYANGGVGVPNAKLSVFISYEGEEHLKDLYAYGSVFDNNEDGVRYNLLPDETGDICHADVGTMPSKRVVLDNDTWIEVFDGYYKYTTRTNNAGDYMIYGVPVGMHTIHMDVDLSDIGILSQTPRDMIYKGYDVNMFESPSKFRSSTNLSSLVQLISQNKSVYVYPFCGDTTESDTNAAITRCDIELSYKFEPTCVFIGSVITDSGENSLSKKCIPGKKLGKMADMITGEGKIEMIRKSYNGDIEQYSVKGNKLINSDGVWCYQIPMNLDYIKTNEFGELVLSDDPNTGIPTRTRVRFRISMAETLSDVTATKRARFLVPNNPRHVNSDYPEYNKTHVIDYEFGSKTKDESFKDMLWNKVYTVKSYIPRLQKSRNANTKKYTGIKMVNHSGSNNPMPFNNLRIKFNFNYRFMCALLKVLVRIVSGINAVLSGLAMAFMYIAKLFVAIADSAIGIPLFAGIYNKRDGDWYTPDNFNEKRHAWSGDDDDVDKGTAYMFRAFCHNAESDEKKWDTMKQVGDKDFGVKGLAAIFLAITYALGCGIVLKGLCETDDGDEKSYAPGANNAVKKLYIDAGCGNQCDDNVAELYNCIENQLAQDNEVTSFDFVNDWVNGVLYFPLWYRKYKRKRSGKIKDRYCATDNTINGAVKPYKTNLSIYQTCAQLRSFIVDSKGVRQSLNPLADDAPTVGTAEADDETGYEKITFATKNDTNCYGYDCIKDARTRYYVDKGLVLEKKTMLDEYVYYYKPSNYNPNRNSDAITLFATDIVLLGSLNSCDIHGVPQFFKALQGTTYNMPPDLLTEDYDFKSEDSADDDDSDANNMDEGTIHTEFTGADWGNLGVDQTSAMPTMYSLNTNENQYDNGGLFYGLTCFNIYTKPKSCINLARICEFGVSLDETQEILNTNIINTGSDDDTIEDSYELLTADGFISYDDILNPDYRSMFATLNGNFLRTRLNNTNGLTEYDFNHYYVANFDGSLSNIMKAKTVNDGYTEQSHMKEKANYINNYKLETNSDAYMKFRYGDYSKLDGQWIYFYDGDKVVARKSGYPVRSANRLPRYENSFYFYFGLNSGSTAIDKFNTEFFSDCLTDVEASPLFDIDFIGNSWCNPDDNDGMIWFTTNMETPISVTLTDKANSSSVYTITDCPKSDFYIGNGTKQGYKHMVYEYNGIAQPINECIPSGDYWVRIVDGNLKAYDTELSFHSKRLQYDYELTNFTCSNTELINTFANVYNTDGSINMDRFYKEVADTGVTLNSFTRTIGGYIKLFNIVDGNGDRLEKFDIILTPTNQEDFGDVSNPESYIGVTVHVDLNASVKVYVDNSSRYGYCYVDDANNPTEFTLTFPFGMRKYKINICRVCANGNNNMDYKSTIVNVMENTSQLYINGIDYDMIKMFRDGWSSNTIEVMNRFDSRNFNSNDIFGWNDLSNIGHYKYGGVTYLLENIDITINDGELSAIVEVLLDNYAGYGVKYTPDGTDNLGTPYMWAGMYVYSSKLWSEQSGDLTTCKSDVVEKVNEIISNRYMFAKATIGAFTVRDGETELKLEAVMSQPPAKYLICDSREGLVGDSMVYGKKLLPLGTNENLFDVYDMTLQETELQFVYPTLTSNGTSLDKYTNNFGAGVEFKYPYYIAVQDGAKNTLTAKSRLWTPDNFELASDASTKKDVAVNNMFGVHFYDKPTKVVVDHVWEGLDGMPVYTMENVTPVTAYLGSLLFGQLVNGMRMYKDDYIDVCYNDSDNPIMIENNTLPYSGNEYMDTNVTRDFICPLNSNKYGNYTNPTKPTQNAYALIPRKDGEIVVNDGYCDEYRKPVISYSGLSLAGTFFGYDNGNNLVVTSDKHSNTIYYLFEYRVISGGLRPNPPVVEHPFLNSVMGNKLKCNYSDDNGFTSFPAILTLKPTTANMHEAGFGRRATHGNILSHKKGGGDTDKCSFNDAISGHTDDTTKYFIIGVSDSLYSVSPVIDTTRYRMYISISNNEFDYSRVFITCRRTSNVTIGGTEYKRHMLTDSPYLNHTFTINMDYNESEWFEYTPQKSDIRYFVGEGNDGSQSDYYEAYMVDLSPYFTLKGTNEHFTLTDCVGVKHRLDVTSIQNGSVDWPSAPETYQDTLTLGTIQAMFYVEDGGKLYRRISE